MVEAKPAPVVPPPNVKKSKLKKELKKAGAKSSDDVDFEHLFGKDPEPEPVSLQLRYISVFLSQKMQSENLNF